jgi:hypothetical protein
MIDCVWNVTAHAHKPDFVFLRNGLVHLNWREASVQSTAGSQGVRISGSNAGYTMIRGSVKSTGYPLHLPVSPSLPLPCVTVCDHISTGLYLCYETSRLHLQTICELHSSCFAEDPSRSWVYIWSSVYVYVYIQGDSGGICTTLGDDSMSDSKQKSSYEHGSDF